MKNLVRCNRGTSMIEFALVAPMLIFLFMGLVEVGRYTNFAIMAANAARAGVQYGAQNLTTAQDNAGMENAALNDAQNVGNFGTPTAQHLCSVSGGALETCSSSSGPPAANTVYFVEVNVTGTFKPLLTYPGIPSSVPVSGNAIMRVADQ
jgi:Flp pilus assembly protein TadG